VYYSVYACQDLFAVAVRDLLARVFPDDVIEGFAHKGTHGNHGAAGNFLEFREPLGISIETALYLLGLANHATSVAQ